MNQPAPTPADDLTSNDIVDAGAFRERMADVYRRCLLAGADMRVVADVMERVRHARGRAAFAFPTWRELDDQIGLAVDLTLQQELQQLRAAYRQQLAQATVAWAATQSFEAWMERLGVTLAAWRIPLCEVLTTVAPPSPDADAPRVAFLAEALRCMHIDAWDLTRDTFEWLASHRSVRPRDRAFFRARVAQIDLFFGGTADAALAQVDQAAELSDDETLRADLECVRGQCYRVRGEQISAEGGRSGANTERAHAQRDLAIAAFESSTRLDPVAADPLYHRGDMLLDEGDTSAAESWYRQAISAQPGAVGSHVRLFRLLARLNRHDEIPAVVARAVAVDDEAAADTLASCSEACREAGKLEAALEYAERAVLREPDRGKCFFVRGRVLMAQEEWPGAIRDFRQAVKLEPTTYAAKDWRWDFLGDPSAEEPLLAELSRAPQDPIVRQALSGLVARWHNEPGRVDASIRILDTLQRTVEESGRGELANARGDVYYFAGMYAAAREAFAEAWRLDRTALVHGTNLVATFRELRAWDDMASAIEDVFRESKDAAWRARELATMVNGRGNDLYSAEDYRGAQAAYLEAARHQPDEPVYWSNSALACTTHLEGNLDDEEVTSVLAPAAEAMQHAVRLRPDDTGYRRRLADVEAIRRGVGRYGTAFLQRLKSPIVLRVDVSSNLVDFVAPDRGALLTPELQRSVDGMRKWLRDEYGTEVPGVRFREDESLGDGFYRIALFGTVVRTAAVSPSLQLLVGRDALARAADAGITGPPGVSPLNGEPGVWLASPERERAIAIGLTPWTVMDFVVYDVAYQVLRRLKDLVGHDETLVLLRAAAPSRLESFERDGALLTRLVQVLRALLAERVPIVALDAISGLVAEPSSAGLSTTELVAQARLLAPVRRVLPGRHALAVRVPLPAEHAESIRRGITTRGAEPVLALAPEPCSQMLEAVRRIVAETPGLSALVVTDPSIRPFVRRVVETEFPQLWVVSQAECAEPPTAEGAAVAVPADTVASAA